MKPDLKLVEDTGSQLEVDAFGPAPQQAEMPFAVVDGEPITQLPKDLYIPPDALQVFLEAFEGPLDLLLYLIRRQNLDVLDIPIAEITRQYMQYIEVMQELQLELAGEYLLMAAMLAEIKSRMLLPHLTRDGEEEEDPRAELVRRLQEYERFKKAAEDLDRLPRMERDTMAASVELVERKVVRVQPQVSLREMLLAFKDVLSRADLFAHHHIRREQLSVRQRMSDILDRLRESAFIEFVRLFDPTEGRMGVTVTFIAVLELMKEGLLEIVQAEPYAPIHVRPASGKRHLSVVSDADGAVDFDAENAAALAQPAHPDENDDPDDEAVLAELSAEGQPIEILPDGVAAEGVLPLPVSGEVSGEVVPAQQPAAAAVPNSDAETASQPTAEAIVAESAAETVPALPAGDVVAAEPTLEPAISQPSSEAAPSELTGEAASLQPGDTAAPGPTVEPAVVPPSIEALAAEAPANAANLQPPGGDAFAGEASVEAAPSQVSVEAAPSQVSVDAAASGSNVELAISPFSSELSSEAAIDAAASEIAAAQASVTAAPELLADAAVTQPGIEAVAAELGEDSASAQSMVDTAAPEPTEELPVAQLSLEAAAPELSVAAVTSQLSTDAFAVEPVAEAAASPTDVEAAASLSDVDDVRAEPLALAVDSQPSSSALAAEPSVATETLLAGVHESATAPTVELAPESTVETAVAHSSLAAAPAELGIEMLASQSSTDAFAAQSIAEAGALLANVDEPATAPAVEPVDSQPSGDSLAAEPTAEAAASLITAEETATAPAVEAGLQPSVETAAPMTDVGDVGSEPSAAAADSQPGTDSAGPALTVEAASAAMTAESLAAQPDVHDVAQQSDQTAPPATPPRPPAAEATESGAVALSAESSEAVAHEQDFLGSALASRLPELAPTSIDASADNFELYAAATSELASTLNRAPDDAAELQVRAFAEVTTPAAVHLESDCSDASPAFAESPALAELDAEPAAMSSPDEPEPELASAPELTAIDSAPLAPAAEAALQPGAPQVLELAAIADQAVSELTIEADPPAAGPVVSNVAAFEPSVADAAGGSETSIERSEAGIDLAALGAELQPSDAQDDVLAERAAPPDEVVGPAVLEIDTAESLEAVAPQVTTQSFEAATAVDVTRVIAAAAEAQVLASSQSDLAPMTAFEALATVPLSEQPGAGNAITETSEAEARLESEPLGLVAMDAPQPAAFEVELASAALEAAGPLSATHEAVDAAAQPGAATLESLEADVVAIEVELEADAVDVDPVADVTEALGPAAAFVTSAPAEVLEAAEDADLPTGANLDPSASAPVMPAIPEPSLESPAPLLAQSEPASVEVVPETPTQAPNLRDLRAVAPVATDEQLLEQHTAARREDLEPPAAVAQEGAAEGGLAAELESSAGSVQLEAATSDAPLPIEQLQHEPELSATSALEPAGSNPKSEPVVEASSAAIDAGANLIAFELEAPQQASPLVQHEALLEQGPAASVEPAAALVPEPASFAETSDLASPTLAAPAMPAPHVGAGAVPQQFAEHFAAAVEPSVPPLSEQHSANTRAEPHDLAPPAAAALSVPGDSMQRPEQLRPGSITALLDEYPAAPTPMSQRGGSVESVYEVDVAAFIGPLASFEHDTLRDDTE